MRRASTDRHGFTHSHMCTQRCTLVIVEAQRIWGTHTHLCLGDRTGAFVFLREEEADGHEELVDADSELLLIVAPRGQWEETAGLDNVLEDVLTGLEDGKNNHRLSSVFSVMEKKPKPCESDIPFGVTVKEWHDITFFKSLNFMI